MGVALVTLVPLRVVLATITVVVYYLICRMCTLFVVPNKEDEQEDFAHLGGWRRTVLYWSGRFLSRVMLFAFGFIWIQECVRDNEGDGDGQSKELERPGVIISNHVSHMDILYHMSSSFPSFVAKRSVGKLPLVGLISKCLGCVYVQRESKSSDTKGVSAVVNERIQEAHQDKSAPMMMLFPEGTTTNGDYILPFKTGAFLAKAPVLPVILKYPYERFSPAWDSISGARHVILLLCQFVNYMTVTRLPVYYPSQEEKDDPKLYAENVRRLMAREGNLIMTDIGLAEKRVYHAALNGV
ncbi:Phospholipid/glycerol acyltransferase [Artemisia annua]|uniref:Phospholipid/glycerol acyltransferase n=1 Tax=Artemisia annua TaxID=35608 RepID=A0A2U1P2U1_ARTAN|nr:Phospholipid/glycerol acyltransferase [Artemisia annua]